MSYVVFVPCTNTAQEEKPLARPRVLTDEERKDARSRTLMKSIRKIYYPELRIRFRKVRPDNGIYPALEIAARHRGIHINDYCREAIRDRLIADGYSVDDLPDGQATKKPAGCGFLEEYR